MILEMEVESSYCSSFGILRILLYKNITSCIILHEVFLSNYVIRFVNYHMSSKNSKSHGTYTVEVLVILRLHLKSCAINHLFLETSLLRSPLLFPCLTDFLIS